MQKRDIWRGVALIATIASISCQSSRAEPNTSPEPADAGSSFSFTTKPEVDVSGDAGAGSSDSDALTSVPATQPTSHGVATEDTAQAALDAGQPNGPQNVSLPPQGAGLDYQLGGGYAPPSGVAIVSRDRTDAPEPGLYNICYVNGFQAQPGADDEWDPDLLLRDENGDVIIDTDWDEALLDVSTDDKRLRIAEIVSGWIRACKADGFDAVEVDNLDTFTRSGNRITEDDAVAFVALLSESAHAVGLAIAQKNAVELVPRRREMSTDFVVAEECNAWDECDGYIDAYGAHVLMIEYAERDFQTGCDRYGSEFSIVLRDRNLTTPNASAYVYEGC